MAFVVTAGQVNRVRPAMNSLGAGLPAAVQMAPSVWMTYESIWRTQPAVRTVIGFLARNIADLGVDVYRRRDDNDRRKDRDHPLAKLLRQPFPGSKWTQYRLINWLIHEFCIFDSAFWLKMRAPDGTPAVLPVPRRFITPMGDNILVPDFYRLTGTKGDRDLAPDQVVHFFGYNPDDSRTGVSPIETLRQVLAEEYAASQYREQLWRNGARMGGYISRPEKAPRWSPGARARFGQEWSAHYTSNGMHAGGTPILEDGMEYHAAGITPKDAQYVESRQLTREEVAIAFHINPAMLGLMKGQTAGNMPELHKMLYSETVGPWLSMIEQDVEAQLLPDLAPGDEDSVYVEFNLKKKMAGSFEQQAAAISASVGAPWMTRQEARALHNLPMKEGADDLITPLNVVQGGLASPRDTAPDNPSNEESNGQLPGPKPAVGGGG